ncbi:hypothetical protein SLS61_010216 [Didymella pomorum]
MSAYLYELAIDLVSLEKKQGAAAKKGKGGVSGQTCSRGKKRKANKDVDALTGFPRDPDDSKKYVEAGISLVERLMGYSSRKNTQAWKDLVTEGRKHV